MKKLKAITLEMSLKPFKVADIDYVEKVCTQLFESWKPLTDHAHTICVLLWTADGSEILEYNGNMEQELEWCQYIGGANPLEDWDKINDPEGPDGADRTVEVIVENVEPVERNAVSRSVGDTVHIRITPQDAHCLSLLRTVLQSHPGESPVFVHVQDPLRSGTVRSRLRVSRGPDLMEAIEMLVGPRAVWLE